MSDMFPSDWVEDTLLGGLISRNEVLAQDENRLGFFGIAQIMTKAETIMRCAEAKSIHHSQTHGEASGRLLAQLDEAHFRCYGRIYGDLGLMQQKMLDEEVPESELLYGGAPGGGMNSLLVDTTDDGSVDIDDSRMCRPVSQVTQYPKQVYRPVYRNG